MTTLVLGLVLLTKLAAPSGAGARTDTIPLMVQTVPALQGVRLSVNGEVFTTDAHGLAIAAVPSEGVYRLRLETVQKRVPGRRLDFAVWSDGVSSAAREVEVSRFVLLDAAFDESYPMRFTDQDGHSINPDLVDSVTVRDDRGVTHTLAPAQGDWLRATRTKVSNGRFQRKRITYRVEEVVIDGADAAPDSPVVLRGQAIDHWRIPLSLNSLEVEVEDAFFGGPAGSAITLRHPNGALERHALVGGRLLLRSLPPGSYAIEADGGGISLPATFEVRGRSATATVRVLTWLDLGLVLGVVLIAAAGALRLLATSPFRARIVSLGTAVRRTDVAVAVPARGIDRWTEPPAPSPAVDVAQERIEAREAKLAELQSELARARHEREAIETQLKRVLTDVLRLQDSKAQEISARERLQQEREELLMQAESRRRDAEAAQVELHRVREQLEGARWSALLRPEGRSERNELMSQLDGYRRNLGWLEDELSRVKGELDKERAAKKVIREELDKRRLQLENLTREKELLTRRLRRAEHQLELIESIRSERDELLAKLESQDQAGERMAASLRRVLDNLSDEPRARSRPPARETESGPARGAP